MLVYSNIFSLFQYCSPSWQTANKLRVPQRLFNLQVVVVDKHTNLLLYYRSILIRVEALWECRLGIHIFLILFHSSLAKITGLRVLAYLSLGRACGHAHVFVGKKKYVMCLHMFYVYFMCSCVYARVCVVVICVTLMQVCTRERIKNMGSICCDVKCVECC